MTITQLEAFLALCRYSSISEAAEKLYITQPAMSRLLKSLEDELGYPLFQRGRGIHQIRLTQNGDRFFAIATQMLRLVQQAKSTSLPDCRESLRIAAPSSALSTFLADAILHLHQEAPLVDVTVDLLRSMESFRQLQHRQLDIAIVNSRIVDGSMTCVPLYREGAVLVCSQGLLPDGPVHCGELDPSSAVTYEWGPDVQAWHEYWFGKNSSKSFLHLQQGSIIEYFCALDKFWTIIPKTMANSLLETNIDVHEIEESPPDRICYAVYEQSLHSHLHNLMLESIYESLRRTSGITLLF